jgi:hypothetical protein
LDFGDDEVDDLWPEGLLDEREGIPAVAVSLT